LESPVGETELLLTVSDESLTWQTRSGTYTDRTEPLGDLSRWFSASIGEDGTIASVSLPSNEKSGVSAFKKSLVQLLALSGEGNIERAVTSSGRLEVTVTTVGDKNTHKVHSLVNASLIPRHYSFQCYTLKIGRYTLKRLGSLGTRLRQCCILYANVVLSMQILTFDDSRVLDSVVSDEQLSSTREDLLGYPVHSHSELTLLNKVAVGQDIIQKPTGLVSEPVLINDVSK
jgi:hypothetical protein